MFFAGTLRISYYGALFQTLYCLKWLGSPQELDHAKKLGVYDELVVLE